MNRIFLLSLLVFMIACNSNTENKKQEMKYKSIGTIERLDPALDNIISANAKTEIIAEVSNGVKDLCGLRNTTCFYLAMFR
jgi:gluconolactonase